MKDNVGSIPYILYLSTNAMTRPISKLFRTLGTNSRALWHRGRVQRSGFDTVSGGLVSSCYLFTVTTINNITTVALSHLFPL